MRLFAAVVPPDHVIEHLVGSLTDAPEDDRLRWTESGSLHITLAFYGEMDERRVADLTERLARAGRRRKPLQLQLAGSGRFGDTVLWVGVRGDVEPLRRLALSAAAAGRRAGAALDQGRRFRPHITVARSRGKGKERYGCLHAHVASLAGYEGPPWRASEMSLIRSHLGKGPGGRARYEHLEAFALGNG